MKRAVLLCVLAGCGSAPPPVSLAAQWPEHPGDYDEVTEAWTRQAVLRGQYQQVLQLDAVFESPEWRAAHAEREADHRGLIGSARDQLIAEEKAAMAGPYEVELMVTTWDRRENDLDHGKKSVWHVVLVDGQGHQFDPIEIVRDKRPPFTVRAEFPSLGDFAVPYIARFPHEAVLLGPNVRSFQIHMSSERGGLELTWQAR